MSDSIVRRRRPTAHDRDLRARREAVGISRIHMARVLGVGADVIKACETNVIGCSAGVRRLAFQYVSMAEVSQSYFKDAAPRLYAALAADRARIATETR